MKRITPRLAGALLVLALLAGCTAGSGQDNAAEQPAQTEQPSAPTVEEGANAINETATPEERAADVSEGAEADQAPVEAPPEPVETASREPLFEMNTASYRFEPLSDETDNKAVLLSFDDGPKDKELLERMLATLDNHEAKAIFFVNGYRAKQHPELLQLIVDHGQTIGNHAWDHIDLRKAEPETARTQIEDVQQFVEETVGEAPRFFRPPFGSGGDAVKKLAADQGLLYMTWSNGSKDWESATRDKPDEVIRNVMEQLHPGANILMHELAWTADALDELLQRLQDEGYSFIDPDRIKLPDGLHAEK
ncbi:hypothetical protein PA598K_01002 [Paenibacillus sp. 598K]|uniref:polysaccharide deacetylase family protein n=1 Tax=Paenibacillus sp. 598K TaxID=1117987 RepID=UPI000FF9722D|nr:polysaccharide deacetylase family protein [Paenibacillus sp. 598K]GBF72736.1 hypothetical protein PA598K_01002 [Paenibacillus sp. 598K]